MYEMFRQGMYRVTFIEFQIKLRFVVFNDYLSVINCTDILHIYQEYQYDLSQSEI